MMTYMRTSLAALVLLAMACDDQSARPTDATPTADRGVDQGRLDLGAADMVVPDRGGLPDQGPATDFGVRVAHRVMIWVCDTRFARMADAEALQLSEVTGGDGVVALRPVDEPCTFDLLYVEGEDETTLSATPGGYLLSLGAHADAQRVVCASRIEHHAADDGGMPDIAGDRVQRETTGVALQCAAWSDGAWGRMQTLIEPSLDWAPWIVGVEATGDGGFRVRYDRDFSFQFMNLTQAGRPPEDGTYAIDLRVGADGSLVAGAPERVADDIAGAPDTAVDPDACPNSPDGVRDLDDPRCAPKCGDQRCGANESCSDCPADCGVCSIWVDDADQPGYSELIGDWQTADGFGETARWTEDGVAAFRVAGLAPGWKQLWARHPSGANATEFAAYRVVEGERISAEIIEDQRDAPADDWRLIGTLFTRGNFSVELAKVGPGRLYADAIRVDVVEPPAPLVDDGDGLYRETSGVWTRAPGGHGDDHRASADGSAEFAQPIVPGVNEISVHTPSVPMASQHAAFTLSADGSHIATVAINQRNQTDEWVTLGLFRLNALRATVSVASQDGLPAIADAVRFDARPDLMGGGEFVVDDGDALYREVGAWSPSDQGGVDGDSRWSRAADASAHWQFTGLAPDAYDILVRVAPDARNTIAAEYVIRAGGAELARVSVDQSQQTGWVNLGRFRVTSPTIAVDLSTAAAGTLRADQVKLVSPHCEACAR